MIQWNNNNTIAVQWQVMSSRIQSIFGHGFFELRYLGRGSFLLMSLIGRSPELSTQRWCVARCQVRFWAYLLWFRCSSGKLIGWQLWYNDMWTKPEEVLLANALWWVLSMMEATCCRQQNIKTKQTRPLAVADDTTADPAHYFDYFDGNTNNSQYSLSDETSESMSSMHVFAM